MANECIPMLEVGPLTCTASAAVTGKRFVGVTSPLNVTTGVLAGVAHSAAATKPLGIAARDTVSGARLPVIIRPGDIAPVTCSAAVVAGVEVEVAANGKAVTKAAGLAVGLALSTTTAADTDLFVKLY